MVEDLRGRNEQELESDSKVLDTVKRGCLEKMRQKSLRRSYVRAEQS